MMQLFLNLNEMLKPHREPVEVCIKIQQNKDQTDHEPSQNQKLSSFSLKNAHFYAYEAENSLYYEYKWGIFKIESNSEAIRFKDNYAIIKLDGIQSIAIENGFFEVQNLSEEDVPYLEFGDQFKENSRHKHLIIKYSSDLDTKSLNGMIPYTTVTEDNQISYEAYPKSNKQAFELKFI